MNALDVSNEHRTLGLFFLLTGEARRTAAKLKLCFLNIDEMVSSIKNSVFYDASIQEWRAKRWNRWNNVTYAQFKARSSFKDESTRA